MTLTRSITPFQPQIEAHAMELFYALARLVDAPIFDLNNIEDIGGLDDASYDALLGANTALKNATEPYLPFAHDDLRPSAF